MEFYSEKNRLQHCSIRGAAISFHLQLLYCTTSSAYLFRSSMSRARSRKRKILISLEHIWAAASRIQDWVFFNKSCTNVHQRTVQYVENECVESLILLPRSSSNKKGKKENNCFFFYLVRLTPADDGVDAQTDLVGRKRLYDEHIEVETCRINRHQIEYTLRNEGMCVCVPYHHL